MQSDFLYATVSAFQLMAVMYCLWVMHQRSKADQKQMTAMRENHLTMAKLAAASDIATFTALENGSESPSTISIPNPPMDDESVVLRMQEMYGELGLDPSFALNKEDPLADFGGTHNII